MAHWLQYLLSLAPLLILGPMAWRYRHMPRYRPSLQDTLVVLAVLLIGPALAIWLDVAFFTGLWVYASLLLSIRHGMHAERDQRHAQDA